MLFRGRSKLSVRVAPEDIPSCIAGHFQRDKLNPPVVFCGNRAGPYWKARSICICNISAGERSLVLPQRDGARHG